MPRKSPSASEPAGPRLLGLDALRPDSRNARRRTQRSASLIERSLSTYGAARSIVVDEDGVVLAGNGTLEAAAAIGIDKVLVIPADGNTLIAVQRSDLSATQKREYAISDNRSSDLSEFDAEVLLALVDEDPDLDISPFFTDEEFRALLDSQDVGSGLDEEETKAKGGDGMEVKLAFENEADFDTFLQSLSQLSAALPDHKGTEQRLQYVMDQFLSKGS